MVTARWIGNVSEKGSAVALELVGIPAHAPMPVPGLRFDRRAFPRTPVQGWAMAAFYDEDGAICLTRVELIDSGPTGMGLRCEDTVPIGTRVCVYHRGLPVPHRTGIVVHRIVEHRDESGDDAEARGVCVRLGVRCETSGPAA